MPKVGPYSNNSTLAKIDGRSKQGRLVRSLRAELLSHIGPSPSIALRLLVDQAVQLQLRLSLMDAETDKIGQMTERRQVQYLAWSGALTRTLDRIGIKPASKSTPPASQWSSLMVDDG